MAHGKLYDISVSLGDESIDFPGDTPYERTMVQTLEDGGDCNLSEITMSAHAGTHMDAPYHFFNDGKTIDRFPVEKFILSAWVVPIRNDVAIAPAELKNVNVQPGEAILFKTRNSTNGLIESGVFHEGIDYISIEKFSSKVFTVHRRILGSGIPVLEGINLKSVPPGRYTLYCFPLKIGGGDGAPVRAVLDCFP